VSQELGTETDAEHRRVLLDTPTEQVDLTPKVRKPRTLEIADAHGPSHHDEQIVARKIRRHGITPMEGPDFEGPSLLGDELGDPAGTLELGVLQDNDLLHLASLRI
jgi:hypothetical protein